MYLNVVELAESLGVDEGLIEAWVRNEGLPYVPDRGRLLFDRAQVVAWATSRGMAARVGFLARRPSSSSVRRLEPLLRLGGIWRDVPSTRVLDIVEQVLRRIPVNTPGAQELLVQRLHAPGGLNWAPIGGGLALPHLRTPVALGHGMMALLFLLDPPAVDPPAPDGEPVTHALFFMAPSPRTHLELLSRLSTALTNGALRSLMRDALDDAILTAFAAADDAAEKSQGGEGA